ncbi:unnamed protein product [Brachionus calyciflorus]|uniref:Ras GTPase-activating protein n=1 Tax=Brachionus calyciflorus TaxID=104777 RepID=A0A813W761_9BILA|nr:unnamed protein product [Brachionus calyciflorus]
MSTTTFNSNTTSDQYVPNTSNLEIDSIVKNSNILYKGWILTYQDLSNDIPGNLSNNSLVDNLKWVPKFAVISRSDKCVLLYDKEPITEILSNNFQLIHSKQFYQHTTKEKSNSTLPFTKTTSSISSNDSISNLNCSNDVSTYRLDNSVNNELFVKYWKSKLIKFDSTNTDRYFKSDDTYLQKDIESLNQTTNPESSSTFRFAGLFFKKDKTDKVKHSSLKRAKSGIQLERKKVTGLNPTVTITEPKINHQNIENENRNSLPSPMRPSRSHESLSSPLKISTTINNIESTIKHKSTNFPRFLPSYKSKNSQNQTPSSKLKIQPDIDQSQIVDCLIHLNLNSKNSINSVHNSLFNEENCFEIKCPSNTVTILSSRSNEKSDSSELDDDDSEYSKNRQSRRDTCDKLRHFFSSQETQTRYFMCRSSEERDKWLQCLRDVSQPNLLNLRRDENSLQVWLLEAKGTPINSKPNKKYFCEIYLNNSLHARTCPKEKKDILFWGENFEFTNINCEFLKIDVYQQVAETQKKKSKKDLSQNFLGFVNIPMNSIESSQPVEKWYKLEPLSAHENKHDSLENSTNSSISFTTTQNFSKDSISIRIKAKYQSVDILPFNCYEKLIEFIRLKYLNLITLEPFLNVRIKDDLANSLVKIAYKLKVETKFLTDLVLAEVLQLEDTSLTFRGNSLATKSIESYMKLVGENYLKITLSDCVRSIIETPNDLEIDPSKVSNQSSLNTNREELVQILHLVCGRVFNSFSNFPLEMKQVFSNLRSECKKNGKTDEMCDTLISASIFLRFICPAILSPNLFNLTQEYPQEKAARKLTLTAKTLQTIANFSKFGGKEFYMSYDKMNQFVDEHTNLMRDFLRKISTLTEDEKFELKNEGQVLPILTLTPQTPKSKNLNYDLELVDLGKQLSILHSLLSSIENGLDEQSKIKFDSELSEILEEINRMKKMDFTEQLMNSPLNSNSNNKLYSYENRLHFAVMKNQRQDQNSPITPSTPSESTPSSIVNSNGENPNNSSSSSSRYSSQMTLNINNNLNDINYSNSNLKSMSQVNSKESELNLLKQKLKETELSLKKEQTEKYLIEFKLKQQQQENEKQMRNVINRLIKVEEELRKEQNEMHKLLKAKQEMIEIQKKRIEYLSNRSLNGPNLVNKSTQHPNSQSNNNLLQNNSSYNIYQPKLRQISRNQPKPQMSSLSNSNETLNSNPVHSSQPSLNKLTEKPQIAASPSSSSSSMTQFCSYLTNNGKNPSNNKLKIHSKTATILDQLPSNSNSLSSSTSSNISNLINQAQVNGQNSTNFLRASEL